MYAKRNVLSTVAIAVGGLLASTLTVPGIALGGPVLLLGAAGLVGSARRSYRSGPPASAP